MNKFFKSMALVVGAALVSASAVHAQDSGALIDALVKKGVLSDQEAEEIRVDLIKDFNTTSAGKIELSSFINHLKFFGDARVRYQYQNAQSYGTAATGAPGGGGPAAGHVNNNDASLYRFRLRLGAEYTYDPHWSAVVRLETADGNDSTNTNFGNYWDKNANGIFVGQVYLRYQDQFSLFDSTSTVPNGKSFSTVTDPGVNVALDFIVGRAPTQIRIDEAFWDDDLNPDGLAEQVTFTNVGVDGLSFAARGAQYILSDNNANGLSAGTGTNSTTSATSKQESAYLFVAQLEGKYAFAPKANIIVSPLFLTETPGTFNNSGPTNQHAFLAGNVYSGANTNLAVLGGLNVAALPIEVNFRLFNQPNRVFGTYGVNLTETNRLQRIQGFPNAPSGSTYANTTGQNTFWNAGYQIGELKKKGDWLVSADYRWIEALAYTPNLSDSDFGNGLINQQGFAIKTGYNITDFLTAKLTYYHSNPIRDGGANAATIAGVNAIPGTNTGQVDIVQADLNWKF